MSEAQDLVSASMAPLTEGQELAVHAARIIEAQVADDDISTRGIKNYYCSVLSLGS
jgi:hypothetical protein